MSRPTRRGTALRALLAGALVTPLLALSPPAAAAPGDPAPAAGEGSAGRERPLRIEVTRLEPRALTPEAPVTVAGTVTNTGDEALTDLDVRLQRGEVLTTRADLVANDGDPDPMTAVVTPFQDVADALAPGGTAPFLLTTTREELGLDRDGVYPVLLNLNGADPDGQRRRLGELATYLVQPPAEAAPPVDVGWLWPLVERPHRNAAGRFVDDGLAEAVAPGGRLDRALAAVERLPGAVPPEGGAPSPVLPVTLAVDPALVEALALMAEGPYDVAGEDDAGRGTAAAAAFLDRLRAVAAGHRVVALPYGDVDADALAAVGLTDAVTRTLPGTPEGTAQAAPGAEEPAATEGPVPDGEPRTRGAGAELLRETLGVEPRTDLAWPAGGAVRTDTLATLRAGGVDEVVLGPAGLTGGEQALGLRGAGAAARTTVPTAGGALEVLVADSGLGALVQADGPAAHGVRVAEQRYLAELALLALRSGGSAQSVLAVPPRDVDADPVAASALLAAADQPPWLRPASLPQLAAGPARAAGALAEPAGSGGDAAGLVDVAAAVAIRDDLAGAVAGDVGTALAPYDAAIARAASVAWREDPDGFRAAAADLRGTLGRLREQVTLLSPADGTYSLASRNAPLVLTVQNDLPFAVRVLLRVQTRGNVALSVGDLGERVLAPDQRTTLQVPTEVRQSGRVRVIATLTTPDGGVLGEPVELQVKSTAYGAISLAITIGAGALLGLLFLRRLVLFLLRRRRGRRGGEPAGTPEGAAAPLPPTRSPV